MDYKGLGKRIRLAREKLNMTQQQLAEAIDMSPNYIGKIERADRVLSLETLVRIANALGTSVDYLLNESVNINSLRITDEAKSYILRMNEKEQRYVLDIIKSFYNFSNSTK